ncbi:MAG: hypothetical protein QXW10_00730 [Candidatus Micrarchaeaceae archaeon]
MNYAREHIRRYCAFAYRKALGASMVTFAIALAAGFIFTSVMNATIAPNYVLEISFWAVLIIITTFILIINFVNAHVSITRYMNDFEHKKHTKYTGAWLAALVIGALVFLMPILFLNSYIEPFIFLFSFGGILWVVYFSTAFIFKNYYHELAFGAIILWIFFALGVAEFNNFLFLSPTGLLPLAVSMVVLIITFGVIGTMLLFNSTKDFVVDFERGISSFEKELKVEQKHGRTSRSNKRSARRKR